MTLGQMIEEALAELDYTTATTELPLWRKRLTRFANEAQEDLFRTLRPWRRDPLPVSGGTIDLNALPHPVSKVLGVERSGMRVPFYYGATTQTLYLKGVPDGPADVVYRYSPTAMSLAEDEPQLPSVCHPLIVLYMVARFETHNDAQGLNHANTLLSLYETRKRRMKMDFDEPAGYGILNRY